jgi:hypothetical protein
MADAYRLRIDMDRLTANLATAEAQPITLADARDFLMKNDFIEKGEFWICERVSLRLLHESEVLSSEAVD